MYASNHHPGLRWRTVLLAIALNLLVWLAVCAIGAAAVHADQLRQHVGRGYAWLLRNWMINHALMAAFSTSLFLAFLRWPRALSSARRLLLGYVLVLLVFLPWEVAYVALADLFKSGLRIGMEPWLEQLRGEGGFTIFLEFAWTSGTYLAVAAVCIWRAGQQRERAWRQAQNDNLRLSLELERQRMLALRAQLEPHFIFNALNAISALVRTGDEALALGGIHRLSELLRYALAAGTRDWASVGEELAFLRDYLALQRLRYGARLRVQLDADEGALADGDCPPLLLQPLVENALRHDLDCHEDESDIRIAIVREGGMLSIRIGNPVAEALPRNPGLGLGLANTRARLELAYRGAATLHTERAGGRFEVAIRMPLYAAEAA
jgi:hypothetical protein